MDRGQILLVRIPQGAIGEDVSSLLGALIVAKIQLAAHSRVDTAPDKRRPFWLYVDEFHAFATSSFARILTEARAFRLGLVCCSQYPEQLSRDLQLALSRTVATTVRCSRERNRHLLYVSHLEDENLGVEPRLVIPPPPLDRGDSRRSAQIRELSRRKYGRPREQVEAAISGRSRGETAYSPSRRAAARAADVDEE